MVRAFAAVAVVALFAYVTSCRDAGERIEAVESLPRSALETPLAEEPSSEADLSRGPGDGSEILEFGLFGPVLPAVDDKLYESDCSFENEPYETCL